MDFVGGCYPFQYGTQEWSIIVQCAAAVIQFRIDYLISKQKLNRVYTDIYHSAANCLEMQAKWTRRSMADLWDAASFEPAAWYVGSTSVFSTVHIIIYLFICALLAVHRLCCYVPSFLIGPCWSKPDSKSIKCIPLASVLVDIKKMSFELSVGTWKESTCKGCRCGLTSPDFGINKQLSGHRT